MERIRDLAGEAVAVRPQRIVSPVGRIAWEQAVLPRVWKRSGAGVLLSVANFAPLLRGRDQVLDRRQRPVLRGRPRPRPARSAHPRRGGPRPGVGAPGRVTVTPSEAMASLVAGFTDRPVVPVIFGPGRAERRAAGPDDVFTFVHRTHWGPHKRLVDVLEAVRLLAETDAGAFRVRSACDPRSEFARSFVESRPERALLEDPAIARHVTFETFPVEEQAEVRGDAVLMPSVTESFSFPLAEAVGIGLPVVAADAPFARELCGDAAFYVAPHDPAGLAAAMRRLLQGERPPPRDPGTPARLSWAAHVDGLAAVCRWACHGEGRA